jgi:hypothetical protein
MPIPGMPTPNDAPAVVIPPITRGMFWTLIITIAGGFGTVIWVLVSLVYGGLKDEIKDTKESIKTLSDSYREAVTSGIKVQDLIAKSPTLEKAIGETHDAVIKIQDGMEMLNQKVDANQQQTKIQLDNIQKQVHTIPGVK